ncbi:MAG TPA: 4-(cytidine 5'-diphospho)-2-C-methyl-D-erythritol kinase [Chitinophagaceae bacterium]|nr:4-(cytidine 5'-diphospho)-2-C-methyl-D-erythritol kinase [Chitinophagaceae bacterium]
MIAFPNCKINLGLSVLRKREDGYHDLETVFFPVGLRDIVEIVPADPGRTTPVLAFSHSGLALPDAPGANLCEQAYQLMKTDFPFLPPVRIHLHKAIPLGAGLGGGSADAAAVLKLLNAVHSLGLSAEKLAAYALKLGSDCPFFLLNKPALARGRGERLQEIPLKLDDYRILLVNPGIHIPTARAFSLVRPAQPAYPLEVLIRQPVDQWRDQVRNDFEEPVFDLYPEVGAIRNTLYAMGASFAALSGSGSTVFGLFRRQQVLHPAFPAHYFVRELVGQLQ